MADDEYSIAKAFEAIEDELIASIIRNLDNHKVEEANEEIQWVMWQVEQLKSLDEYKRNKNKYNAKFKILNRQIEQLIRTAEESGEMEQEIEILQAIKDGAAISKIEPGITGEFFKLNERKLDALVKAVTNDMQKAEVAILRQANDQYRKIIYNAQVYANSGAGTYAKAIDMATHDMLAAGLNCVQYANGARHTLSDYAGMAIRTASKRAYLQGEGTMRQQWGTHLVVVNKRSGACSKCMPFVGKILIDDVWSGGSKEDGDYQLMSYAVSQGLYHPNCKDVHTTYFPRISALDPPLTQKDLDKAVKQDKAEQQQQYAQRNADRYNRLAKYSLDEDNQQKYAAKAKQWREAAKIED